MSKKTKIEKHFDEVAESYDSGKRKYALYYSSLKKILKYYIPKGSTVCEIGCGTGDLLASVAPARGYGMDLSDNMIKIARSKYDKSKNIKFSTKLPYGSKYDYIFMCDVIEHLEKPGQVFNHIAKIMHKKSVFINTMANPLWEPLLMIWEKLGLKMEEGPHKRISYVEINKLMVKSGLRVIYHDFDVLIPVKIPVLTELLNKFVGPVLHRLNFIEYVVAVKA